MADFFCGLDVGGTSTRAVVADAAGRQVGWGYAEGANPSHLGWESVGSTMQAAVFRALKSAGLAVSDIRSVFLGMAGVISPVDRQNATDCCRGWGLASSCVIQADHDIRIALHGGLAGRPGISLIAGTGSACFGRNAAGESWQAGGWDQILDDLGSAYDVARRGMVAACQSADGRLPFTRLREVFFEQLHTEDVVAFAQKIHRPRMPRHEIAALAPLVLQTAEEGDAQAKAIVRDGATELARMVQAVTTKIFSDHAPEVVFIGSLLQKSPFYRDAVQEAIRERLSSVRFCDAEFPPAIGAWLIAAEQAGATVPPEVLVQLSLS